MIESSSIPPFRRPTSPSDHSIINYTAFFQKRAKQNANIFVTHRLGAAVSADEICVLEKGRLVEQGTHKQLMENKDGLYYQMFCAQKGMYE